MKDRANRRLAVAMGASVAILAAAVTMLAIPAAAQTSVTERATIVLPPSSLSAAPAAAGAVYPAPQPVQSDRYHLRVTKSERGTTKPIPQPEIIRLCADEDGCTLRLGMYNWDNSGRVASRESLFYYNQVSHTWRASEGDPSGTDFNGATEHVMNAWACYVTDGVYDKWKETGDPGLGFGLLSWNQYDAECWLTIID
jgi:hypothetical protein